MKILIEQCQYSKEKIVGLLDSHYYNEIKDGVVIPYVGYFLSKKISDTVFVLPKVFLIKGKAFGKYEPSAIINFDNLDDADKKVVFFLSVWIYRAIKCYCARKQKNTDDWEIIQNVVSHHGDSSQTMLDIVLSLLKFHNDHQNLFTFITKIKHSGQNKIHWQKTISNTQAILQKGKPVYLDPRTKQKEINFDEELIVMFFSVLNYLSTEFHFDVKLMFGYNLIKPSKIKDMISSGKGKRMLRQNRYKYFTDEMIALWNLLFTFFSESEKIQNREDREEQAMLVRDFNLVFENMIDSLIGESDLPSGLKEQKDGKIIDHIYRDHSLIDTDDDIYFIGDSKYYKEESDLGSNSIYKQFTYAKNVIQYSMDFFHKNKKYEDGIKYRDDNTEGYNITPNFFIRGHLEKDKLNDYSDPALIKESGEYISCHFENRLFDRDTLILQSYNINFLFVLSAYVQGAGRHTEDIRKIFRDNVKDVLTTKYDFYVLKPKVQQVADKYLKENFQKVLGKLYVPYEKSDSNCLSLALDNNAKYKADNESLLKELDEVFYRHQMEKVVDGKKVTAIDANPEEFFGEEEKTVVLTKSKKKDGVLMVMMEDYDSKSVKFLNQGVIAVALKSTQFSKDIRQNIFNIGYVFFHTRNDDEKKHLFAVESLTIIDKESKDEDVYATASSDKVVGYVQVLFRNDFELMSDGLKPKNAPYDPTTRYDAQYVELNKLR